MSNLKPTFDAAARNQQIGQLRDWLTGVATRKPVAEHYPTLAFDELKEEVEGLTLTTTSSAEDLTRAGLAMAAYRDMRYAHASRGYMLALGAHNSMREVSEGVIVMLNSGQQL